MTDFRRAFGITVSVIFLVLILVFAFEFVNETVAKSGFSSGEVFVFDYENGIMSGEFLGQKFHVEITPVLKILAMLENLTLLLPPPVQLFLRFLVFAF